jgi:conjugal transfer pilus assembly protein TraD
MSTPPPPRPRPYWLLLVLAAILVAPPAIAAGALIAATAGVLLRAIVARRTPRHAAPDGAVLLGSDAHGRDVALTDQQLSAHGLIVGASGAGKSTTLLTILTDRIRRGRPVVAIDLKGSPEFAEQLKRAAEAAGRPFRVWTPDGPSQWNPLQHGNATELKDKLISTERFTEPHYQRAAERYVQAVLGVLEQRNAGRTPTLDQVVELMEPVRLATTVRGLPRPFAERVQDYVASLTPDQVSAVRGLGTRLAIISESHTGRFLNPAAGEPPIDLRGALAGDEVVLFSLNSSTYGKLSAQLGTLVIQDLVAAVGHRLSQTERGRPSDERAFVAIDEFSALGSDHVVSLLARAREAGVTVLLATQELADLERAAPGFRDQVLGNTALKIIHRQDVPWSARVLAELIGTRKVWEETRQIPGLFGSRGSRGSRRLVDQHIFDPNQIKSLRTGEAFVSTKTPRAEARSVRVARPAPPALEGPEL